MIRIFKKETSAILLAQYTAAVDLYKHEDSLNWNKAERMIYANAGLFAVLGFVIENRENSILLGGGLILVIMIVGFVVCLLFAISIWSGTKYMSARKARVSDIETALEYYGALPVVNTTGDIKFFKRSPTVFVLKSIPVLFCSAWLVLLCYIILMWTGYFPYHCISIPPQS